MKDEIVLYPSPGRGHFTLVDLGKLILKTNPNRSFSITILISIPPHENTTSIISYIEAVSSKTPSITFVHLPTISLSTPTPPSSSPADALAASFDYVRLNNHNLCQALLNISQSSNIKALIIDFFCNGAFEVSSSLNIPTYYYYAGGACGLSALLYVPTLHNTMPFHANDRLVNVPGLPPVPYKDLPLGMRLKSHRIHHLFKDTAVNMYRSSGIIVNTFRSFEQNVVKAISNGECMHGDQTVPPLFCVGPLIVSGGDDQQKEGSNRDECMNWLDSQPSGSVVYLSFGSTGKVSAKQLKEMGIGLERSGVRFLWVVRKPPPQSLSADHNDDDNDHEVKVKPRAENESLESLLPEGFLERTRGRGFVAEGWAPQVEVLNHEAVGGFVFHCGWNSALEAVFAGVPMLGWPTFAEQKINRAFLVQEAKVALTVTESEDGVVRAEEWEQKLIQLMSEENVRSTRERLIGIREAAVDAMSWEGGSSFVDLSNLVNSF